MRTLLVESDSIYINDRACLDCIAALYAAPQQTPHIRLIPELRNSIGLYDIDYHAANIGKAPCINAKQTASAETPTTDQICANERELLLHIPLASRMATSAPVQSLRCAFEADEPWSFRA